MRIRKIKICHITKQTFNIFVVRPPITITVRNTITNVVVKITAPLSDESRASRAREKAIAPLSPPNHIINYNTKC